MRESELFELMKPDIDKRISGAISRISVVSSGGTGGLDAATVQSLINASIATHVALADPHPIYMTAVEVSASYVPITRSVVAGSGLTGGGVLSSDVTLNVAVGNGMTIISDAVVLGTPNSLTATSTNAVTAISHTHAIDATIARSAIAISVSGLGLSGGGDLTANRTITLASSSNPGAAAAILASTAGGGLTLVTLTTTGVINGAINTDTAHRFGHAVVGFIGASTYAGFSAYGFNTSTDYAVMQSAGSGDVFVNVPSGGQGHIRAGSIVDVLTWSSSGITSTGSIYLTSDNYVSGWAGSGWRIDQNVSIASQSFAEFDNISIRGTMSVYELIINQIRATNGTMFVSASGKIESLSGSGNSTWTFEDPTNNALCPFAVNDIVIIQRVDTNSSTIVQRIVRLVISVAGKSITTSTASGGPVDVGVVGVGDTVVRIGNVSTTARQGSVLLTSDMSNSPYIDVINGVTSWADWTGGTKTKVRLGLLSGLSIGVSNEYGLAAGSGFTTTDAYVKASNVGVVQNNVNSSWTSSGTTYLSITPTSGINIVVPSGPLDKQAYTFSESGTTSGGMYGFYESGTTTDRLTLKLSRLAKNQIISIDTNSLTSSEVNIYADGTQFAQWNLSGGASSEINGRAQTILIANNTYFNVGGTTDLYFGNILDADMTNFVVGAPKFRVGVSSIGVDNISMFIGQRNTSSSVTVTNLTWGNGGAIGFNAYHVSDAVSPVASGAWRFLGTQYTGNITRPGMQLWDGNSGAFAWYYGEAALVTGSSVTTWTRTFQVNTTNVIAYNPMYIQGATGQYELLRLHGGGTGAANACYLSFYDNAGTTRYGYVGDPATGDSNIALRAEIGALILGDSGNASAITISSGNTKIAGTIGFNNTAPIAKPTVTGSRGGNAALASLLTALANYGLITNSTT